MKVDLETLKKLPPYIKIDGDSCAMRLKGEKYYDEFYVEYFRDGGLWGFSDFILREDGRVFSVWVEDENDSLNNRELVPTTREEWLKDNEPYGNGEVAINDPDIKPREIPCCEDESLNGWSSHCRGCGKSLIL
jgi:hypothetical protein